MDDARRARRMGIAIRLVLYPMALGLIVLAWQHYHGDSSQAESIHVVEWRGVTSQGRAMRAGSVEGRLISLDVTVLERCSDGSPFSFRWTPAQDRFVQHGEALRGRTVATGETSSGEPAAYDNQVRARIGDHPRGTITVHVDWTRKDGTVACDSGPVTFELHR
jgi:hypothetical protein